MKIVALVGSTIGSKTRTAMSTTVGLLQKKYPQADVTLVDLANYDMRFSDGRNYSEYEGDTLFIANSIMQADAIIIGTPTFQASIPATLKNVFDLLPVNGLRDKVVSIIVTAGTSKHYMMVEQQLKPILAYMKAHIVPTYVFAEEKDFHRKEIVNDDVLFRIDRLIDDTVDLVEVHAALRKKKDAQYDF
ncbi:FMN reductase [Solibacillus sp. R5-41]|uniref:NADPH-dependent FMN reductase n=1 Tax=Solibacillus sp. R5-41 TaxID=2048654 RepID=UPI000C1276EC|nr:NADPH-dependent FMN reductase [Solibacillus sp. R5-41]ATP40550.1 FMN reductase [Solibacillus sp. R5-41]